MEILESMCRKLAPLRLYRTGTGGVLDADLQACADALNEAKDALLELERETLLQTAESWGIDQKGRLYGVSDGGAAVKAAVLCQCRAQRAGKPVTLEALCEIAAVLGLSNVQGQSAAGGNLLLLADAGSASPAFAARFLGRFLPAGCTAVLDLRGEAGTWSALDEAAGTCADLDAAGKTWADWEAGVYAVGSV